MVDYLGLKVRHVDSTETGGCSYLIHLGHAAEAIAAGKCSIALITLAGKPRTGPMPPRAAGAEADFEAAYGATTHNAYGMCAMRHMHDYGTTSEQLAWIKVAASHHAQYNPHAMLKDVVTVEDVLNSPMISDPLHRMDCCVVTDGGGALIVTTPEIAKSLKKPLVRLIGHGEAMKGPRGGKDLDLTYSAGVWSGPRAFEEAGVTPKDIKYASIYDSFTITVLMQLEDLGFCKKGEGGKFVADGNLISGVGKLPFNTDGGGLCSNHPVNRGGMTKIIEAVRQLRGEAHPKVQVPNCDLADRPRHRRTSRRAPRRLNLHSGARVMAEAKKYPTPRDQSRDRAVLGSGQAGQVHDQALHRLRRAALLSALDLPVLLLRQDGVGGKLGRGHDLHLQPDAQIADRAVRDRLRHAEGRPVAADQFRRLRPGQAEDRPEGEGGVQADRRRAAAVLHAGLTSTFARGRGARRSNGSGSSPRKRGSQQTSPKRITAMPPSLSHRGTSDAALTKKKIRERTTANADQLRTS